MTAASGLATANSRPTSAFGCAIRPVAMDCARCSRRAIISKRGKHRWPSKGAGTIPYLRLFSFKGNRRKTRRNLMPWRKLLITTAAVAGVLGMVTGNTDAREMGYGSRARVHPNAAVNHNARVTVRTRADFNARAQVRTRGTEFRPPGWSHGRKTGWNCRVGTHGCIPP